MNHSNTRNFILNKIKSSLDQPKGFFDRTSLLTQPQKNDQDKSRILTIREELAGNREKLIERFIEEMNRVGGKCYKSTQKTEALDRIGEIAQSHGARTLFREANMELGSEIDDFFRDKDTKIITYEDAENDLNTDKISSVDIGICSCDYGIAESGSLAILSKKGRGRLISLLPPIHIAVLRAEQIVLSLEQLFLFLSFQDMPERRFSSSNLTFITGPSRTGDIEQTLSIGVHGPKECHTIILL